MLHGVLLTMLFHCTQSRASEALSPYSWRPIWWPLPRFTMAYLSEFDHQCQGQTPQQSTYHLTWYDQTILAVPKTPAPRSEISSFWISPAVEMPRGRCTPHMQMIGMIIVFPGVVIGNFVFLGVVQVKSIQKYKTSIKTLSCHGYRSLEYASLTNSSLKNSNINVSQNCCEMYLMDGNKWWWSYLLVFFRWIFDQGYF